MTGHIINFTLLNMFLFFGIILATFLLSGLFHLIIVALFKDKLEKSTYKLFSRIITYVLFVIGLSFAFNRILQFQLGATLATLGILGGLLILPLIPVLQSIAAGLIIVIERPFKEDDLIEVSGKLCKVKEINLRKTALRSLSGEILYVPNVKFVTEPIINYTEGEFIKIIKTIDFPSNSNIEKIKHIIEQTCLTNQNILPNIPNKKITTLQKLFLIPKNFFESKKNLDRLKPRVFIKELAKDKITLEVWFWIWDITIREQIISGFFEEIITKCKKEKVKFG